MAVFTLPKEMVGFYKRNIEYITEHAVDPDKRRYAVDGEEPRHYIDIDIYEEHCKEGETVFDIVPKHYDRAVEKFTEDTIQAYGIVPWHINVMFNRLVRAFKDENFSKILKYSAEIGHYVGDSHVPLHTTENYNGQLTGQKGIHGFWESRLPELFSEDYDYFVGKAEYLDDPLQVAWNTVRDSHAALDSVLGFEKNLTNDFPTDQKYGYDERGGQTVRTYSRDYSAEYHLMLDGMVERRMRKAIIVIGSMWYSAWVNAGQPDLTNLSSKELSTEEIEALQKEEAQWKNKKIKGRSHEDD